MRLFSIGGATPKFLWTQRSNFGPSPRAFHGTAYDSNRRRVVLFGGSRNQPGTFFGDTWEWDGSYWTQMDDIGSAPRSGHAMSYHSNRRVTLLFGGTIVGANAAGANPNDTWQMGWRRVDAAGGFRSKRSFFACHGVRSRAEKHGAVRR